MHYTLYFLFLLMMFIAVFVVRSKKISYFNYLFIIMSISTVSIMIINNHIGLTAGDVKLLAFIKEAPTYLLFFFFLIYNLMTKNRGAFDKAKAIFIYLIIIFVYVILPNGVSLGVKIMNARDLITVILFFFSGFFINISEIKYKYMRLFLIVILCFSIMESMSSPEVFWGRLGYQQYNVLKSDGNKELFDVSQGGFFKEGSYMQFYTADNVILGLSNQYKRRLGLIYANPIESSQLLCIFTAYFSVCFLFKREKRLQSLIFIILNIFLQILTVGKGGILTSILIVYFLIFFRSKKIFLVSSMLIASYVIFKINIAYFFTHGTSYFGHINGLFNGVRSVIAHPFGQGLGTSGALANINTNINMITANDSNVGNLFVQGGIVLFASYTYMHISILKRLKNIFDETGNMYALMTFAMLLSTYLISFYTEAVYHYVASYPVFILSGAIIYQRIKERKAEVVAEQYLDTYK